MSGSLSALLFFVIILTMSVGVGLCRTPAPNSEFSQVAIQLVHVNGQEFLDLAVLANSLGVEKVWNALGRKVVLRSGDKFVVMFVGSNRVAVEDEIVRLKASPFIVNSAILVPLDFVTLALDRILSSPLSLEIRGEKVFIFDRRIGLKTERETAPIKLSEMKHLTNDMVSETNGEEAPNGVSENEKPLRFGDKVFDVVVIDAGHGGSDTGASGPTGLLEKEVSLKLAMRIQKLLKRRLGLRVVLTRQGDISVSLEQRTATANSEKADLFISLHANGSFDRDKSGLTAHLASAEPSDAEVSKTVTAENKVISDELGNEAQDPDEYARMLWELSQNEFFREATALAGCVLEACQKNEVRVASGEPKQGPFIVLMGASMPAVLLEIGYLTNPADEQLLKQDKYLDLLADAISNAVAEIKARSRRSKTRS
ncbi:N-acetylmuramoyl-L-alanine amidase [bacterium]|nr:N-acetylmuramoyl-L-alanine amidase [bacterium]